MTAHAADVIQLDGARVFSVPSSTVDGRYYRVEEWRGTWKCPCPSTKTDCKHVRRIREVVADTPTREQVLEQENAELRIEVSEWRQMMRTGRRP